MSYLEHSRRAFNTLRVVSFALLAIAGLPTAFAQGGGAVRPTPLPIDPGTGTITLPGGGVVTLPGIGINPTPGGGNNGGNNNNNNNNNGIVVTGGATSTSRITADPGILVGTTARATAVATNQTAAAPATGGAVASSSTTYLWSISGGRIIGSSTSSSVDYIADNAGTVNLSVSITSGGVSSTASSNVTAISGSSAGLITAPVSAAPTVNNNSPTITVSVPAAQRGDRTFRWSATGGATITNGQNNNSATIRPGAPGLKELTCDVTLQGLVTVPLRAFVLVNGDGAPTSVTINNGSGGGIYNATSRVDIFANPPAAGQVFDRWIGDVSAFGANAPLSPFLAHSIITVPTTPVTLTATYKPAPAWTPTTITNFNPQSQTPATGTTTASTAASTTLSYHIPPSASAIVFLLHDTGSSNTVWFNTPEGALLTRDLVAAGYGVAALANINRTTGAWSTNATLPTNPDALNHVAALNRFIQEGLPAATKPIFFLGIGGGADAAVNYANLLATTAPARTVLGAVLYCSAGNETLAVTSKIPQFFALASNDSALGTAGSATARANAQLLAGRGLAAGSFTNSASPVHPGRFRPLSLVSESFTEADATAIWSSLKNAKLLDANNYVASLPTMAALTAALPEAHRSRAADVASQLSVAYAAREFFSDSNIRVINFLNSRLASAPVTTPGRMVNLSSRANVAYVGASFRLGFSLGGGTERATLLIRGVGPGLARFGVPASEILFSPRLEINDSAGRLIASNERWDAPGGTSTPAQLTAAAANTGAFPLAAGSLDAAVLLPNLPPGSYTATLSGVNGSVGDVLAEVYDVSRNSTRLTNLSTLARVADAGDVVIPGIVVQGTAPRTLLVRAIGPGLSDFGLPANAILSDPRISVLNAGGATLDTNNNWTQDSTATLTAVFPATGAFPLKTTNPADAALVTSVNPGSYTLQAGAAPIGAAVAAATGVNTIGSVLVEIYEVP